MTTETLAPYPIQKFFANDGTPLAYGKLTTYAAGTTTPIATYSDSIGTTNTNPIILNARGECSLWLTPNVGYKLSLTDSSGNLISGYPVDQIVNSQLLTLYAGVDTGSPNAYILTYNAPYTSYTQGNPVIYFVASNSNTGPSTVNVNNLGIVPIVNPNGSVLTAGQIVNNQMTQIVWQGGQFILTSIGATAGLNIGTFGPEASLASSNVTDLGSSGTHTVLVTGSATITALGTSASINAPIFTVRFSSTPVITFNGTSLITPTGGNIQVAPGDWMLAQYLGSGNWKILSYQSTATATQYVARTTVGSTTSSTVIAQDTQLKIVLPVTGTYAIQGWINDATGTSAGGLKGEIAFSGSFLSGYWSSNGLGTGVTTVPLTAVNASAQMQTAQSGVGSMPLIGMVQATSTGTLSFSWAQQASNATSSIVGAGSWLEAVLVSNSAGAFSPVTHIYTSGSAGSGSEVIPIGATTLTIEVWGGAAFGGVGVSGNVGGGGGSGGYSKTIISVIGSGGQTLNYSVGTPGTPSLNATASSVTSGTFAVTTLTGNGGAIGTSTTGGAGGTATGGVTLNTTGNAGASSGAGGAGGAGIVGTYATGGKGGNGVVMFPNNGGAYGIILFYYA